MCPLEQEWKSSKPFERGIFFSLLTSASSIGSCIQRRVLYVIAFLLRDILQQRVSYERMLRLHRGYCVGPNEAEILRITAIYSLTYCLYLLQWRHVCEIHPFVIAYRGLLWGMTMRYVGLVKATETKWPLECAVRLSTLRYLTHYLPNSPKGLALLCSPKHITN
jgi:hypothetical protein